MRVTIPILVGTVKIKTYRDLRPSERDKRVPIIKVGPLYLTYLSRVADKRSQPRQ